MKSVSKLLTPTLASHFEVLYVPKRLWGKSEQTIRLYHHTFRYFGEYLGREPTIKDLTDEKVMGCMQALRDRKLSIRTANKTRDQLVALWSFLARKGIVKLYPEVPAYPEPQRTPVAWSKDQLNLLWEMCAHQGGQVCGIPANLYWLTLHSVAWDTLERIGAIKQLRWDDMQGDQYIYVRPETRKGRTKDATPKLHETTLAMLDKIREPERELIFPWSKNPSYFWTKYKTMRGSVGLPTDRWHSFHCIRKTGASFAEASGHDASKLLGHSGRRVTERHYLDPKISGRIHASDLLFRPELPPAPQDGAA